MKPALFILLVWGSVIYSCKSDKYELRSPNGNILVQASFIDSGLHYCVYLDDTLVVRESPLGIALKGVGYDFITGLHVTDVRREEIRDTFMLTTGKRKQCFFHANQLSLQIKNRSGKMMQLIFRSSNDGIGFRYILPNEKTDTISREVSGFTLPSATIAWAMAQKPDNEGFYLKRLTDTMQQAMYVMPMLFQTPSGKFVLIHEADVMHRYAAASLRKSDNKGLFSVVTSYPQYNHYSSNYKDTYEAVLEKESSEIIAEPGLKTPWRVLLLGNTLKPIVESTLIEALCPPPPDGDYSWVKPGVTVFPWWGNNLANGDTNALKSYIDLAASMNWKFIEFDVSLIGSGGFATEQWRTTQWIKRVVDYAASRNISVYGWDERRNLDTPEKRADIFGKYREFGIKGIKIDFINSIKQDAMAFREACLKDALKHKLLVSFHGDYPPRGERRTYPNIATQEGVKGAEYYLFAPEDEIPTPEHNCTLPFTRNVVGPMDYTPVAFSHPRRTTTYAHELALSVVVESGWLTMCDKPEYYLNSPAIGFLKKLVSVWDESVFLGGYPGEYFCIARRNGHDWYVAGINAGAERKISLKLEFLKETVTGVTIYTDGENPRNTCRLSEITCSPDQPLGITMAPDGGFALIIPGLNSQSTKEVNLLIRGDDIGSSHTSNVACIESYRNGIMRSVELMVSGPWFPEAVRLLNENPGLDVGVHLVVTSEWNDIKWRPLTCCPSLVDKDGYFYPMIWQRPDFPAGTALKDAPWKIEEIEKEFRAQIEIAKRHVPHISHVNCHMGCESCAPEIANLVERLAEEYKLNIDPAEKGYKFTGLWGRTDTTADQRIKSTIKTLKGMKSGNYIFIDHPGLDTPEMRAIWHTGYENVAADRDAVTRVFTSKEVIETVNSSGIRLVSYKYLSGK